MTKRGHALKTATIPTERKNIVDTPPEVTDLLALHLTPGATVSEVCAGAYRLADRLQFHGLTIGEAFDIAPRDPRVEVGDATVRVPRHLAITNPPFQRDLLMPILTAACRWPKGGWFLLPSDVLINRWFSPFAPHIVQVLPIGRVSWFGNGRNGYENYCWVKVVPEPQTFILARQTTERKEST
jgi:hypothetical protein